MSVVGPFGSDMLLASLEAIQVGVQLVDREWRYRYLNAAALRHGQTTTTDTLGRTMMECYPGIDETEMWEVLAGAMAGERATFENRFQFPNGSEGWFELHFEPFDAGVMILSIDVTARKQAEMRARHGQKMETLGRLAAGAAHDFNNLLTVIQACASFALLSADDDWSGRAELEQIISTVNRGSLLTKQLVTFSRGAPCQPQRLVLSEVVAGLEHLLARAIGSQVKVKLRCEAKGWVFIDRGLLEQVIVNLAVNAREAMPDGGELTIETAMVTLDEAHVATRRITVPPGRYVVLSVADTGIGMSPALQERIFEPFFTTKADCGGTGLGLATCWGIVRQANGYVWPYSIQGVGTTFRVYLPEAGPPVAVGGRSTGAAGGGRVLVVDDDVSLREQAARILANSGYSPVPAGGSVEAMLRLVEAGPCVAALVDYGLPGTTGLALGSALRRVQVGLPVVLMSGLGVDALRRAGLPEGTPVLDKPFRHEALLRSVAEALGAAGGG